MIRSEAPRALALAAVLAGALFVAADGQAPQTAPLRVCADPNNLPFSNAAEEGFENAIARLVAEELGTTVEYTWWAQRRGFIRNTLKAGLCDVVMGLPTQIEMAATTAPYYRSGYVFVSRPDRGLDVTSFDDPRLRTLRVGVQLVGDDGANTPPAHALSERGIVRNVVGFTVYGDYAQPNPPARIIEAVADGRIDLAIAWGPMAGFFARRSDPPLAIAPVHADAPGQFAFDISLAVRHGDDARKKALEAVIGRRRAEIDRILADYGVPRLDLPAGHEPAGGRA